MTSRSVTSRCLLCCCLYIVVSVLSSLCYESDVLFCSGKLSFIILEFNHRFICRINHLINLIDNVPLSLYLENL